MTHFFHSAWLNFKLRHGFAQRGRTPPEPSGQLEDKDNGKDLDSKPKDSQI